MIFVGSLHCLHRALQQEPAAVMVMVVNGMLRLQLASGAGLKVKFLCSSPPPPRLIISIGRVAAKELKLKLP